MSLEIWFKGDPAIDFALVRCGEKDHKCRIGTVKPKFFRLAHSYITYTTQAQHSFTHYQTFV